MIYNTRSDIVKAVEYQSSLRVGGSKSRLYYCKAWIIKPDFSDFLILQSYSTIVAARKNLDDDFASVISTALNQH